jgi:hypothetical protein
MWALPAGGQELPKSYVRGDLGQAVEVPWLGLHAGRTAQEGAVGLDLGLSGSPGEGVMAFTAGLEVRAASARLVSPFGRLELGGLVASRGGPWGVVSLGGGLAVRVSRSWALRAGLMYSLDAGDSIHGPDYAFVGIEYRFSR